MKRLAEIHHAPCWRMIHLPTVSDEQLSGLLPLSFWNRFGVPDGVRVVGISRSCSCLLLAPLRTEVLTILHEPTESLELLDGEWSGPVDNVGLLAAIADYACSNADHRFLHQAAVMSNNPLILGMAQCRDLATLRWRAATRPVDMRDLAERLKSPEGKCKHMDQMTEQSIELPMAYFVTFSIEIGHPVGAARHMTMSSQRRGKIPTEEAVWMVAQALGFTGSLRECIVWPEDLQHGDERATSINVLQIIESAMSGTA